MTDAARRCKDARAECAGPAVTSVPGGSVGVKALAGRSPGLLLPRPRSDRRGASHLGAVFPSVTDSDRAVRESSLQLRVQPQTFTFSIVDCGLTSGLNRHSTIAIRQSNPWVPFQSRLGKPGTCEACAKNEV